MTQRLPLCSSEQSILETLRLIGTAFVLKRADKPYLPQEDYDRSWRAAERLIRRRLAVRVAAKSDAGRLTLALR